MLLHVVNCIQAYGFSIQKSCNLKDNSQFEYLKCQPKFSSNLLLQNCSLNCKYALISFQNMSQFNNSKGKKNYKYILSISVQRKIGGFHFCVLLLLFFLLPTSDLISNKYLKNRDANEPGLTRPGRDPSGQENRVTSPDFIFIKKLETTNKHVQISSSSSFFFFKFPNLTL